MVRWYTASCGGTPIGTGNNLPVNPTATTTYFGRYEDGVPCNYNSACAQVTVTVIQNSSDPTSATASPATICNGQSSILTLNGGGGGTGVAIHWYSASCGGTPIGIGDNLTVNPIATTTYYGRYEDGAPCNYNTACAEVTVTINSINPGIISSDQTICLNADPNPFTSPDPGSASGTITYRWERSASPFSVWSTIPGATAVTYDAPGPMIQTMKFRRVLISTLSGSVCEATSNILTITVFEAVTAGQIGTNQTICNGETPNPIVSIVDGTGGAGVTISYYWEISINGGSNWSVIPGETGSGLTLPALTQSTMYRRYTVSSLAGFDCSSLATIAVTITVQIVPTAGAVAANQTICNGTSPLPLNSVTNGTGNPGATISYEWWQSIEGGINWTIIPLANAATYSPTNLFVTTYYRRVTVATLNGHACRSAPTVAVIITVQGVVQAGQIAADQTICYNGDPAAFTSITAGSGSGTISYRWEIRTGGGPWNAIAGATSSTYDPAGPLTVTTQYRRIAISIQNLVPCEAWTNPITITILSVIVPPIVSASQTICYNTTPAQLTRTNATGGTGTFTYQWQSSPNNITYTDITGQTGMTYSSGNLTSTMYYRVYITSIGSPNCGPFLSNVVTIIVRPQLVPPTICCDQVICAGSSAEAIEIAIPTAGGSGTPYSFRWQVSTDNIVWTPIAGATSAFFTPTVFDRYYRLAVTDANCGIVYSNSVHITTSISLSLNFPTSGLPLAPVCPGFTFTYTISSGNLTFSNKYIRYSWSADPNFVSPSTGGPSGNTIPIFPPFIYLFQLQIDFTLYNNTNTQVITPIVITPIVYNNNGSVYCTMSPVIRNVTINPFHFLCQSNIVATTTPGACSVSLNIPNFQWVTNSCTSTINWTMTGATTGSGTGNIGTYIFNRGITTITYSARLQITGSSPLQYITTSCFFTVTVTDNQLPTIICPSNINLPASAGLCSAIVNYTPPVGTDNCPGAVTTQTAGLPSGSSFPVGITTNTFQVADAAGNISTCSFTVTVTDNEPPIIADCPTNYTLYTDPFECYANLDPDDPAISDNCSALLSLTWEMTGATIGSSPLTGVNYIGSTDFNTGRTTVTYSLSDASGNAPATCTFTVTVFDNEPAYISCPLGVSVGVNSGACTYTYTPGPPIYYDNCGINTLTWVMAGATTGASPLTGINLVPATAFNLGITTITYNVTDAGGNTASSCSFTVNVTDDIPPTITCAASPQNRNANNNVCSYTAIGSEFDPIAFDNCPGYILENNLNFSNTLAGYIFPSGTTNVTWILRDGANAVRSCTFNVVVTDNQLPSITCPPTPANICAASSYTHSGTTWNATATDNCSLATLNYSLSLPSSGTGTTLDGAVFNIGVTTVTWTATDVNGNIITCSFNVTISPLPTTSAIYHQ